MAGELRGRREGADMRRRGNREGGQERTPDLRESKESAVLPVGEGGEGERESVCVCVV